MGFRAAGAIAVLCLSAGAALRIPHNESNLGRLQPDDSGKRTLILNRICPHKPCFILRRISKTAGTYITKVLYAVVNQDYLTIAKDDFPVDPDAPYAKTRRENFLVGTMRNPCSMSLSLARHTARKPFMAHNTNGVASLPLGFNGSEYRQWVNASMIKDVGYSSYFFWMSFSRPQCLLPLRHDPFTEYPLSCSHDIMVQDLAAADPSELADCWVRSESVLPDLRKCLVQFQSLHSKKADVIDWKALEELERGNAAVAVDAVHSPSAVKEEQCSEIFQDNETEGLLKRADRYLFSAFGYSECCTPGRPLPRPADPRRRPMDNLETVGGSPPATRRPPAGGQGQPGGSPRRATGNLETVGGSPPATRRPPAGGQGQPGGSPRRATGNPKSAGGGPRAIRRPPAKGSKRNSRRPP